MLLEPGQLLWYESARLPHGRPRPFNGSHYDNVFVHYRPAGAAWYRPNTVNNGTMYTFCLGAFGALSIIFSQIHWELGERPAWRVRLEEPGSGGRRAVVRTNLLHSP